MNETQSTLMPLRQNRLSKNNQHPIISGLHRCWVAYCSFCPNFQIIQVLDGNELGQREAAVLLAAYKNWHMHEQSLQCGTCYEKFNKQISESGLDA